jgi:hypothetical protein
MADAIGASAIKVIAGSRSPLRSASVRWMGFMVFPLIACHGIWSVA